MYQALHNSTKDTGYRDWAIISWVGLRAFFVYWGDKGQFPFYWNKAMTKEVFK